MQLWRHAMNFTAEVVLEGIAKAGSRGKCTPMGRAAMSLDLQVTQSFACNPNPDVEGFIALHCSGAKVVTACRIAAGTCSDNAHKIWPRQSIEMLEQQTEALPALVACLVPLWLL